MEPLKHECGVALLRLKHPTEFYQQKYGSLSYGLNKLYLMMEKQHNRGQEGAGLAVCQLEAQPGEEYMFRERAEGSNAITDIFQRAHADLAAQGARSGFTGEALMGHLRYSTTGRSGLSYVHPFLRRDNWRAKNLALCGNFNLTNVDRIMSEITAQGQHPRAYADTFIILEQVGHRLDRESERLYQEATEQGLEGRDITQYIEEHIQLENVLSTSSPLWDGGYVICGLTGTGEQFALRDPWGLRTAFWYEDDEVVVLTSERPVIQTAFDVPAEAIHELQPGEGLFVNRKGEAHTQQINAPKGIAPCSFERIYFSRGSDQDIYRERKMLGRELVPDILRAVGHDVEHTVFSFIPNTAEVAFYGMLEGLTEWLDRRKAEQILALEHQPTAEELRRILSQLIRSEKVALKDIKMRTFITQQGQRDDLAAHVYDITYGTVRPEEDQLVVIDDSIVRGTTLRQSIIRILARLRPRKIVIVSSSPQVRYPDFYGIDMSHLSEFIAFRAAISLLRQRKMEHILEKAYEQALGQRTLRDEAISNCAALVYAPFSDQEITAEAARLLTPEDVSIPVEIVYQPLEGLHKACPNHRGDWYFSGHYPTPGGTRLVNEALIDFVEQLKKGDKGI